MATTSESKEVNLPPPIVYGELSILGYNGYIPNVERNGRRNKSKFLLCKRTNPNGIKKSRHYIVKQPQATKAIQDKDLHSISYTFSRSQTIIVEYKQDENTDMFQIGRSSEDPIDFVVMDTLSTNLDSNSSNHHHHHHNQINRRSHNENNSIAQQQVGGNDMAAINRYHRHLAKVDDMLHYGAPPPVHDSRNRLHYLRHQAQAVLLNYPQPNISNLPQNMADHFRNQESIFHQNQPHHHHQHPSPHQHHLGHSSGAHHQPHQQQQLQSVAPYTNGNINAPNNNNGQYENGSSRHNLICKRSHATQSTISRFACRILVDRRPPHTARIYAAGFDSSKNIFLGEKATKWEQDDSIDGLTTNGVLLMHPKQGQFYEDSDEPKKSPASHNEKQIFKQQLNDIKSGDSTRKGPLEQYCSNNELDQAKEANGAVAKSRSSSSSSINNDRNINSSDFPESLVVETNNVISDHNRLTGSPNKLLANISRDSSNNCSNNNTSNINHNNNDDERKPRENVIGGVWREVSVDGGIYAIRESRSAAQKGTRIGDENNILQDGTLIDLCGATLLWRSVDGFKASPTKKSLEEKIDMLNASRPQCPVGLNTLVIPRKPILPTNQHHRSGHHKDNGSHHKDNDKNSHQPYVYLKCGHVQGYHDWGATEKSNQRTCPICLSVGMVAKLSMGLEPSFYVDSGPLTHVFNPCGHMASERTVKYWCSIKIPHGTHFFHSICPFCAVPLSTTEPSSTKLIFQDDLD